MKRVLLLLVLLGLAFAGLGYRLVDLQVLRHDELSEQAQKDTQHEYWQAPRRGDILDAHGNLLATSIPVETVCADPTLISNRQAQVAHVLAPLLNVGESDLLQKLLPRVSISKKANGENVTNISHYVRLQKNVSEDTWQKIHMAMTNFSFGADERKFPPSFRRNLQQFAIFNEPSQLRVYPNGTLAAQVLGFSSAEDVTVDEHVISKIVGRDGIELMMNTNLSGVAGWRKTDTDRQNVELAALRDEDVQPRDGLNVTLTIDAAVQHIVEDELADAMQKHAPESITGIVIRPRTGEVLAMASLPDYDPNNLQTIKTNTNNEANLNISAVMEPGSTFKTIVISAALNEHVVTLDDTVFCENGLFIYGGIKLHDAEHDHFGTLTVRQVLQKSSNIGAAKIGIKLGPEKLYDYMTAFGLGQATGIALPRELSARPWVLPPIDPVSGKRNWKKYSIAQIPMGQGVAVTRLQMAMVLAAIANNGVLMRPMLVKNLQGRDGKIIEQYQPQAVRRVIAPETAKLMVDALKTVVTTDGTAPKAALTNYVVAGKTGTAEKTVEGQIGYAQGKYIVTFIGFFPADNPEICISIVMDSPKEGGHAFGGALCGPVFHDIAERCASYLNIPPDRIAPAGITMVRAKTDSQTP